MLRGGGGTQGRHGIVDAKLGQGDDVQVALHHQQALGLTMNLEGLVQAIEFPALVEDGCLGGIQVFGLAIAQDAAAQADDPPPAVADGKDDAVAKAVVDFAILIDDQPRQDQVLALWFGAAQAAEEEIPVGWGIAQSESQGDLTDQAAPLEVVHRPCGLWLLAQLLLVKLRGLLHDGIKRAGVGALERGGASLDGDLQAGGAR